MTATCTREGNDRDFGENDRIRVNEICGVGFSSRRLLWTLGLKSNDKVGSVM